QTLGGPLAAPADLETAIDGLVSGSPDAATAITAVDDYFNLPGGGFETNIYLGSTEDGPRLHITDDQSIDPLPKADDPLFRLTMQGYALIASATNAPTEADRDSLIQEGLTLLDTALESALSMESRLGAAQERLERTDEALQTEATLINKTLDKLLGRDVFDAAAELQALEGQLEASYTVTARLGSLSLTNFLR
ncbi:MAG: flagellin, partial [Pseudomonadota bacterium]